MISISRIGNLKKRIFHFLITEKYLITRGYRRNNSYKVLFFGSDGIALSSLKKVNELRKKERIIEKLDLVTANNSKNKTIIEKFAQAEGLQTISWPLLDLKPNEYDLGLIVAFGHLIKDDVLNKFPLGMVNVHPSLLPRWRGAAPIIHTLLHGDQITGVTLMKIKPNVFDVGEIISQTKVPISKDIKLQELTEQLSAIGAQMLVDCLRQLPESLANAQPQAREGVTYAKKILKSISDVRWLEMSAVQVYNLHRALDGLYPLSTKFKDKPMKLFNAFLDTEKEEVDISKPIGSIEYYDRLKAVRILCKDKRYIYFRSVRIVGKKEITALDFYNGYIKNMPVEKRNCLVCKN